MRQMNINKGNYEVKSHYKMYKAGKRWVVAGMATVSLLGGLLMLSTDASADNVDAVVPASESSVTTQVSTPTDSVVLDQASASVAPASSVSAEVSASSASSVAPVSVSTAASVVSADASLSASQSLASSFVVPADAKKVQDDVDADGNVRKAYVLATTADTQTPDSAVTPVQTNAAYTSSTEAKSASLPAVSTSGTIAASSYIKTDSAQNHTSFSYSGSSQISDYFNRTGDIVNLSGKAAVDDSEIAYSLMGAPQATVDEYLASQSLSYYTSNYNSIYSAYLKYGSSTALNYASTYGTQYASASMSNSKASLTSIYNSNHATNIPSSFSNAIKTANEVAQSTLPPAGLKQDEINWKALVPEFKNEGGTLSYNSQLDVSKGFVLKGGYRLVSINQSTKEINISSTVKGAQAVGVVMAPVQPTVMGTTSIAGSNSLNNNDAIATIKKAVIAGRDMYVNNVGDVNSMLVHIRQTDDAGNLYGSGNGVGVSGESSSGYGWATTANGNVISNATNTAGATEVGTDGVQLTTTKGAAQGDMYNGVYFSYTWANPTLNTNGTVTATLTYTEYSDASMHTIIGSVSNILTVDRYMAVGLYAANGGNGNSFFGGISYFEGTNATTDVKVSYTFGEDGGKLLDDTTINAVVGEVIQVIDEKNDSNTDSGMNVSLVAPKIAGLKIDPTSTKTATAGSENIVIKYMVSQKDFTDQVEIAKASLKKIDDSIAVLQKMIDVNPSTIDVQSVLTKTQDIRKQAADKIDTLQAAATDSVTLKTVVDIQKALKNIMQGANDVAALATDASNQIELAAVITNNSASIKKNISDDDDATVAKSKINNDIATGQSAEDIAKDKADLEGKISVATQNRNNAIVDADKAIADNTVHNTLVDGAKSALQVLTGESTPTDDTHTKTEIKAGIDNLTKVSSVDVPGNIMDSQDVKDAIANVTDLLIKKPTDTSAIDAALQTLKDKINQAKLAVVEAVKDAQVVVDKALPTNVADQNTTDSDYAKDMKALQDKLSDKDAQLKDIQATQDAVTGDLAAMQKKVSDAKTAAQAVAEKALPTNVADQNTTDSDYAKDMKALQDKLSDKDAQLKDIQATQDAVTGDLAAMQKKVSDAKTAAQAVAEKALPTNVADQNTTDSDYAKDMKALQDKLSDKDAQLKDIQATQDAVTGDLAAMQKKVSDAKTAAQAVAEKALPTNVADQNTTDSDYAKDMKALQDKLSDKDAQLKDIQATQDAVTGDLAAMQKKVSDAKTAAQAVAEKALPTNVADQNTTDSDYAKDMKALQDKLSDKDAQLKDIQATQDAVTGDLAAMQKKVSDAKTAAQAVADKVLPTNVADQNTTDSDYAKDLKALQGKLSDENAQLKDIKAAQDAVTDDLAAMQKKVDEAKVAAKSDLDGWNDSLYKDQTSDVKVIEDDISKLKDLTNDSNNTATKSEIEIAQKKLQDDIAIVTGVRNDAVKNGNTTVAANKDNGDPEVKLTVGKLNIALQEGTASDIKKAIDNVKTAVDTVVVPNISDSKEVADAKTAVNDALNAPQVNMSEVQKAVESFNKAVATAQATLKQAVTDANAVNVPANLQDQVEMAKKNKLGDVNQQVTDLHKAAGQDDTTASTLRSAMNDIQGSLDDMKTKLNTTRDAAQKLVEQTADATDANVVAARKQVTNLLANNDTTTMTDLQNAINVLTATSKPATANTVETSPATVESDQVSTPVANGDAAFAIVTDANGKQTVVQLNKTENGTATANVPGATDAQVVTVPKNGNKPFIFVTDGSGTAQYTELTPNGAKTTITPDGSTTKVVDGVDVPAGANVDVIYLPTAEVSVQAGAKNVAVPGKTGYTATVTDAQGNEVTLTDGMIAVDGVPAGTNYLVTYTPDPAKVVVKLGTDSGFAKGEEPAAGNTNAQTLMTVQDALNKLQKDDATLAAIVSTGYTDTKVNVTNAVEALNRVDQNLNIDGYAHRIQAPDGTQYNSLEDAVKANPTFAAGTTQMKVVYAPLDGQKIQVKDADGNVLGTVMGKSDAEINVDDFKSVDADLQATAEKGKLKMTVTAPDGKTYDSLMDALQATGYFDHVGLADGPSSFDQSDAKFVATAWDETGKATAGYMVLGEPATPNDLNIQDFVVSFAPANDGAGHNNTNAGSKTGSSVAANNQNGDHVNVAGPANGSRDGSEVNNATVAGQASGAQVTGSQTGATANTAQNAGWQAQGATQNSDNTASLLAAAGNEQQANTANSDDARITEMPDSAAVIQDSILPLESAKQAMNLTGRVTEDNFLVVVAAMVASGLFGLLLAFWRRRKEDDQATR